MNQDCDIEPIDHGKVRPWWKTALMVFAGFCGWFVGAYILYFASLILISLIQPPEAVGKEASLWDVVLLVGIPLLLVLGVTVVSSLHFWRKNLRPVAVGIWLGISIPMLYFGGSIVFLVLVCVFGVRGGA